MNEKVKFRRNPGAFGERISESCRARSSNPSAAFCVSSAVDVPLDRPHSTIEKTRVRSSITKPIEARDILPEDRVGNVGELCAKCDRLISAHPRTRSSIPNHRSILLPSNDSAIRGRRGQPRLYRKLGMSNNDSWGLTPAELR